MMIAELTGFFTATQPLSEEQALIRSAQRGGLEAFNGLVLRYQQRVYNVAYRIMGDEAAASDATQEAFISAYRHIGLFHEVAQRLTSGESLEISGQLALLFRDTMCGPNGSTVIYTMRGAPGYRRPTVGRLETYPTH